MKNLYSKFFNLELNPFGETPDPDFYYSSPQHNRALTLLSTSIKMGKGFSLLTGEVGTGKTLLSRILLTSVSSSSNTALILYPKFTEMELLQAISEEFEIPVSPVELKTPKSLLDHLNRFLLESRDEGKHSILLIDEAQALSVNTLEMIRLLTNLETKTEKLLQIILIAQPEIKKTLDRPELRQLKQRIGVEINLQGLDPIETEKYIKSRIEQVSNGNFLRFDSGAVKVIHSLSSGIPRRINQLCEQVIMTAETRRIRLINAGFASEALGIKPKGLFSIFSKKEQG